MAFTEDLLAFLDTGDFAVTATYDSDTSVVGIFGNAHELAPLGMAMHASSAPAFICRAADIDASPTGKAMVINSISYTIAEHQPDGAGMTTLILKRSS